MIWFTSDWHLYHTNIIKYCDRPFKNSHHMNKTILENYHSLVKEQDEIYFLGDLTMCGPNDVERITSLVESLPGNKHLILGNHDKFKPFTYEEMGFQSIHTALRLTIDDATYTLVHDPAKAQEPNSIWVCGHVHNHWKSIKTNKNSILVNVGVDVWEFKPIGMEEIRGEVSSHNTNMLV